MCLFYEMYFWCKDVCSNKPHLPPSRTFFSLILSFLRSRLCVVVASYSLSLWSEEVRSRVWRASTTYNVNLVLKNINVTYTLYKYSASLTYCISHHPSFVRHRLMRGHVIPSAVRDRLMLDHVISSTVWYRVMRDHVIQRLKFRRNIFGQLLLWSTMYKLTYESNYPPPRPLQQRAGLRACVQHDQDGPAHRGSWEQGRCASRSQFWHRKKEHLQSACRHGCVFV